MKTRACYGIAAVLLVLILSVGPGLAKTSLSASASINPISWIKEYIDPSNEVSVGSYTDIAFDPDSGTPWISYYDESNTNLIVAHRISPGMGNCGVNNSWQCVVVDDNLLANDVGMYTSIDIYPDTSSDPMFSTWKVGVSYFSTSSNKLRYAEYYRSITLPHTYSWHINDVDAPSISGNIAGRFSSLKFDTSGVPYIAYQYYDQGVLYSPFPHTHINVAHRVTTGGNCGTSSKWQCDNVTSTSDSVEYLSLDIDANNTPYIAYYDTTNKDLKLATWTGLGGDCGMGDNGWGCKVIDGSANDVGKYASLYAPKSTNPADILRIAYYDATAKILKVAHPISAGDGNCGLGNTWQCDVIDVMGGGIAKLDISLTVDKAFQPVVVYTDASVDLAPAGIKLARLSLEDPSLANCGGLMIHDWRCDPIDNGKPSLDVGGHVAVAINSTGQVMVAYTELDSFAYPAELNLKIAYQKVQIFLPAVAKPAE